jgi:IclR family acetate operon transcriptional repressor
MPRSPNLVPSGDSMNSAEKTLAVLEAVASPGPSHRLRAIASRVDLPKSTVHRILQTLAKHGYVMAATEGSYGIGPRTLALAGEVLGNSDYRHAAAPMLRELQAAFGQTVHLAVRTGNAAVYVEKIEGDQPYRMASRIGMSIPLYCTGIGKAILAELPQDETRQLLKSTTLARRTDHTLTAVGALMDDLQEVRTRGYSIDDEENEANVRCVAASVRDSFGAALGGVSISALSFDLTLEQAHALGPHVRAAADAISAALGAPEPDGPDESDIE